MNEHDIEQIKIIKKQFKLSERIMPLRVNWHQIPNYYITDTGRVFSTKNNKLIERKLTDRRGYKYINLYTDHHYVDARVHRAVYESFVEYIPRGMQINHIDGNKANNNLTNLEMVTPKENCLHAWRTGLAKAHPLKSFKRGENHACATHSNELAKMVYELYKNTNMTQKEIAKKCNTSRSFIKKVVNGEAWTSVTGYKKEDTRRMTEYEQFSEIEQLTLWFMYHVDGLMVKEIGPILGRKKEAIRDKLWHIRKYHADELDKKLNHPKAAGKIYEFLVNRDALCKIKNILTKKEKLTEKELQEKIDATLIKRNKKLKRLNLGTRYDNDF